MKTENCATYSPHHERFVLQMDGRVKSEHRRFIDPLRAGLQLRDQFPQIALKFVQRGKTIGRPAANGSTH